MAGIVVFLANLLLEGTGDHQSGLVHDIMNLEVQAEEAAKNIINNNIPAKQRQDEHVVVRNAHQQEHQEDDNEKEQHLLRHQDSGRLSGDSSNDKEEDAANGNRHEEKIQYVSPNGEVLEKPEGTGPTKLGFVMDFVHERGHPTFRSESIGKIETSRQNHAQTVTTALSETNVQPCEYLEEMSSSSTAPRLLQQKSCRDPERALVVYNSAPFARTWCGVSIPPNSAARMEDDKRCTEPVHLFEMDFPPVSGQGMSPIIVHSHADGNVDASNLKDVDQCSIPCKMEQDMTGIARYIQGTDWSIFQSDQDPGTTRDIQVELSKYKHDEYFSTAYFKSDVPLSRFDIAKHSLRNRPPLDFDGTLDKAVYIVDEQCGSTGSRRTRWLETVENQYHLDSLGKCKHTKDVEAGESLDTLEGRLEVMKKYKFNLGFEISTQKDWVTELSFEAFLSGAVPILLGASNANRHFPKEGAIYVGDFNNWDKFAAHVNEVASNKELWESYHKWRTNEKILADFERKYQFTKTSPDCRLCSWAYAKMYGLGWDHVLQLVQETHVPRKMCVEEASGLITSPFQEIWSVGSSSPLKPSSGAAGCSAQSTFAEKAVGKDDWTVVKSVHQHDSVTDITIHEIKTTDEVALSFVFDDVNNTEAAFFRNSHTLVDTERGMLMSSATVQDHKSKITILANWETSVWSPDQGVMKVLVQAKNSPELHDDEQRRIRIITEDMGQLHDKMTEYFPSSFSPKP